MATFILAFIVATFCAWCLAETGLHDVAVVVAGLIGSATGIFLGRMNRQGGPDA